METRVSVKLELLQQLLALVSAGRFDLPFGQVSKVLADINQDAQVITEGPPSEPPKEELPA